MKDPQIKNVGVAYMLKADLGASNTDSYGDKPTADNQWGVSRPHVMVITPDAKQLDVLPTDPLNGGPWVMWKGPKYAVIMVPITSRPKTAGCEGYCSDRLQRRPLADAVSPWDTRRAPRGARAAAPRQVETRRWADDGSTGPA